MKHAAAGQFRRLMYLMFLALHSFAAVAQTNVPAPLPPAAQEALNKGIIAAKVPDYLLAIRYFEEARKLSPDALVIYLNMGLAESRIPGRELRAMAWFGAYLAAYPDAPNAAAVKEQIAVLEVRNQSNVSRLMMIVQDALPKFRIHPLGRELPPLPADNTQKLGWVAELWAKAGDMTTALKTADLIQDALWKSIAQSMVATVQAKRGDIAGAQQTTLLIQTTKPKFEAQRQIAEAQARNGDFAGAQKTADLIQDPDKGYALTAIAKAKAVAGIADTVSVYDWLSRLDDDKVSWCPLNTGPFLDLAGYLKSLPQSDDPENVYKAFFKTAETIVDAQNVIAGMLKQQAKK